MRYILLLALIAAFASCKKDDNNEPTPVFHNYKLVFINNHDSAMRIYSIPLTSTSDTTTIFIDTVPPGVTEVSFSHSSETTEQIGATLDKIGTVGIVEIRLYRDNVLIARETDGFAAYLIASLNTSTVLEDEAIPNPTLSTNEVTFISGSCGYNSNTYTLRPSESYYSGQDNTTQILTAQDNDMSPIFGFEFEGYGVGTYTITSLMDMAISCNDATTLDCFGGAPPSYSCDSVVIVVTKYDDVVGGAIEGTFNGSFTGAFGSKNLLASGKFSVIRRM